MHIKNTIHDPPRYTNNDGKTETPRQEWYFQKYKEMPPPVRNIPSLYKLLQKNEDELPYKLVAQKTVYEYAKTFDWEERIAADIAVTSKQSHMQNSDYLMTELWKDVLDLHQRSRKLKKKLDWKQNKSLDDGDYLKAIYEEEHLIKLSREYRETLRLLRSHSNSQADVYAMLEVLKATEQEEQTHLELVDKLLHHDKDDEG